MHKYLNLNQREFDNVYHIPIKFQHGKYNLIPVNLSRIRKKIICVYCVRMVELMGLHTTKPCETIEIHGWLNDNIII